jgi:translation initiation factor 1
MPEKKRIPTDAPDFSHNPFGALSNAGFPTGPVESAEASAAPAAKKKSRGRVDIIRQTAHRGGKTVTVITNFVGIGLPEKEKLAKQMQKSLRHWRHGEGWTNRNPVETAGRKWRVF